MTDADDAAIDDLDALGIDSAELRWLAVRDYLDEMQRDVIRQVNALFLVAEFLDLAEDNAHRRGEADSPEWGTPTTAIDQLTAKAKILGRYKGATRERAAEVIDPYLLPMLRKGAK